MDVRASTRRDPGYWGWYLLLLLAWLGATPALAQPVLSLHDSTQEVTLAPYTGYYVDDGRDQDLAAIRRHQAMGRFAPLPGGNTSFGFHAAAYWFHVRVQNQTTEELRWLLIQQYALSDQVDVYTVAANGKVSHQQGGDHRPFSARSVRYRHPNFEIRMPSGQAVDLYVRVESQSSMQVPLSLYSPRRFAEMSRDAQFGMGIYYGILLALFIYNMVLWMTLKDASYFWYLCHITAFGLVLFTLYGLGFEYLWPNSPWLADKSVPLSICLAQMGMLQFARSFLGLHNRWPRGDRFAIGLIVFFALLGIASTRLSIRLSTEIAVLGVIFSVVSIAVLALAALRRGYRPARLFLLAWSMFLLGIGLVATLAFGLLPKNFVTEYSVQIGSAMEMLLLSVALGYRYAGLRNENERLMRESRDQLERKVTERTSELKQALAELEDAHVKLREFSRHDGLTALYNRAHFRESFENLLLQARDAQRPISLLMIDLDHFKRINDSHGHLVGDDCLRCASHTLATVLAPYDALLARFGGEEFIAALPAMGLEQARAVAEEVRHAMRANPCRSNGKEIPMSASIGVHGVDVSARNSLDYALQVADQALYAAKAEGRDCVRTL